MTDFVYIVTNKDDIPMYKFLLFFFSLIVSTFSFGQSVQSQTVPDTLFFPFYNGEQMIEIDHKSAYLKENSTDTKHRAFPINEYIFRDTKGKIAKAFHIKSNKDSLQKNINKHYGLTFVNRKSHKRQQEYSKANQYSYPQFSLVVKNYYLINNAYYGTRSNHSNDKFADKPASPNYGLIDTLGNIKIPVQYNSIEPLGEILKVSRFLKYGLINYNNEEVLPKVYEKFEEKQLSWNKKHVAFFKTKTYNGYEGLYVIDDNQFIKLDSLNYIHDVEDVKIKEVIPFKKGIKDKKGYVYVRYGFMDLDFNIIIPPVYEILNFDYDSQTNRVLKDGKFGFLNSKGQINIPLKYDYASTFDLLGVATVLEKGKWKVINQKGKKNVRTTNNLMKESGFYSDLIDGYGIYRFDERYERGSNVYFALIYEPKQEVIIPFHYGTIRTLERSKKSKIVIFRDKLYNIETNVFSDSTYLSFREMSEDGTKIIVQNQQKKWGIIDTVFKTVIDFKYNYLNFSKTNPNHILFSNHSGIMNFDEQVIVPDSIYFPIEGIEKYYIVKNKESDLYGLLDKEGKRLIYARYEELIEYGAYNLFIVKKNDRYGVIDAFDNIIVPIEHSYIYRLSSDNPKPTFIEVPGNYPFNKIEIPKEIISSSAQKSN